jgi:hypothetical integral membrane protein (TIGR02206 family)
MLAPYDLSRQTHLALLAGIVLAAFGFSRVARRSTRTGRTTRLLLGTLLAANELTWYGYRLHAEGFRFPEGLPLQLCDVAVWLTVISALTLKPTVYDVAYFAGLGGSSMALLMPDLWAPFPSYPSIYFFISHGLVVITLATLAGARLLRPRPGCVWRAFFILGGFALLVGAFNAIFKTNYMYLSEKPASASLLDFFGPWPVYIAVEVLFALAVFWLLWLPVRPRA